MTAVASSRWVPRELGLVPPVTPHSREVGQAGTLPCCFGDWFSQRQHPFHQLAHKIETAICGWEVGPTLWLGRLSVVCGTPCGKVELRDRADTEARGGHVGGSGGRSMSPLACTPARCLRCLTSSPWRSLTRAPHSEPGGPWLPHLWPRGLPTSRCALDLR